MTYPSDFRLPETEDFDTTLRQFADLRAHCPAAWTEDMGGLWAVTRHASGA